MQVRLKESTDQAWVESVLRRCWGGSDIVVRGCVYKAADLPALIAGTQEGLCTFAIESDGMSAELVTINALVPAKGIGTALIGALRSCEGTRPAATFSVAHTQVGDLNIDDDGGDEPTITVGEPTHSAR